jgi:hypothetical protein
MATPMGFEFMPLLLRMGTSLPKSAGIISDGMANGKSGEAGGGGIMGQMRNCLQSRSSRDLDAGCFHEKTIVVKTLL